MKVQPFASPEQLVEALQGRVPGARAQLAHFLRDPLARLLDELRQRLRLRQSQDTLLVQALHLVETDLRTRAAPAFAAMSWPAFRATLLLQVARLAAHPFGQQDSSRPGPPPLPPSPSYQGETLFLPHEQLGRYWFGGDWYAGRHARDGSLWVLVADVTGHGYYAYLLACGLPAVWQACWRKCPAPAEPAELLALMHEQLADCLPEGVFVECTLALLNAEGEMRVAPAGGSRLLLRRRAGPAVALHKLRGTWLGLCPPSVRDQSCLTLEEDDEVLLGSDGLFDQLDVFDQAQVQSCLGEPREGESLLAGLTRTLRRALEQTPQKDDITVVALRRSSRREAVPAPAPLPSSCEAGDVPV